MGEWDLCLVPSITMVKPLDSSPHSSFNFHVSTSRLLERLRLLLHPDPPLDGANLSSPAADVPHQLVPSTLEIDQRVPVDSDVLCELLVELVSHLQPLLPGDCEWLGEGGVEVIDNRPVAAGQVADVLVGIRGNRKVAIKRYRLYSTSDYLQAYMVGEPGYLSCLSC